MSKLIDLTGKRFGLLTVVRKVPPTTMQTNARWLCVCDCGGFTTVLSTTLRRGETKSCGCLKRELNRKKLTKHGECHTRLAHIWYGMRSRCNDEKSKRYADYGGRGIKLCKEWQESFESFRDWSLSHGYKDNLTIDRIDPNEGYSPHNCRWATYEEQNTHLAMLKTNTSGLVGVSWSKKERRWIAMISLNNRAKRIGSFQTKEEAAHARNKFIEENKLPHQKTVLTEYEDAAQTRMNL